MALKPVPVVAGLEKEAERAVREIVNDLIAEINLLKRQAAITAQQTKNYNAREREIVRARGDLGLTVNLPRSRTENQGDEVSILLEIPGSLRVTATASTINALSAITLTQIGLTTYQSNGNGGWFCTTAGQGTAGAQGEPGVPGLTGATGTSGVPGQAIPGDQGEQGPQGDQGPPGGKGDKGDRGDPGPQGDQGPQGDDGPPGRDGTIGVNGATGATGATGQMGPQGDQGDKGDQGDPGPQGTVGPTGATGDQGPTGPGAVGGIFALTTVEVDLGTQLTSGSFQITGLSGLIIGTDVMITQANGPYTGKGLLADEAEEQISVSGQVISATVIRCYWESLNGQVSGNVKFAYAVSSAVTLGNLPDALALSVLGRAPNSAGVRADIQATAASGAVLRESGSVLGFGTVATAGLANNAVTDAKLRQGTALTVIGRSANTTGNVADIAAVAASGSVLRESGSTIGWGTISTAGIGNSQVTEAKLSNGAALSVLGRAANSVGVRADIAAVTAGHHLVNVLGTSLQFISPAGTGMVLGTSGDLSINNDEDRDLYVTPGNGSTFFRKSRQRNWFFEDWDFFCLGNGSTLVLGAGGFDLLFGGSSAWNARAATGSVTFGKGTTTTAHPGVMTMSLAATANTTVIVERGFLSSTATNKTCITGLGVYSFEAIVNVDIVSNSEFEAGFADAPITDTNSILIYQLAGAVHAYTSEAGVATDTNTGVTMVANTYQVWTAIQETLGTVNFYVDDVLEASHATNVPDSEVLNVFFAGQVTTAVPRTFSMDYFSYETSPLGVRF